MIKPSTQALIAVLLFSAISYSCTSSRISLPPLTEQELAVQILGGSQEETLALNKTHSPLATEKAPNAYSIKKRALVLGADVAQIIQVYTTNYSKTYTVRYWKSK